MKNRISKILMSGLLTMLAATFIVGCQRTFDEPPTTTDPGVTANITIKDLKAQSNVGASGAMTKLTGGKIISGIVVGNDRSGNIYKTIYIQDATGAIALELDGLSLFNQFPVGREVFVLLDSLYIYNETAMIKLGVRSFSNGSYAMGGIPSPLIDKYVKKGSLNNPVVPKDVELNDLNNDYQSMLIRLKNFEVSPGDQNKTWADTSANKATQNINIRNCAGNTTIIRTSGYANFAGVKVAQGNGDVTAIYTVYNTTKQLIIRDTADVQFNGPRCGSNVQIVSIKDVRAYFAAGGNIPANTGIEGVIVSNRNNEAAGNYRIQDANGYGIQIRFKTASNPLADAGDKYVVNVSGLKVEDYQGDLQINNVETASKTGTGTVTPRATTVADIATNLSSSATDNWSSTVVKLSNVNITETGTNSAGTNYAIVDGTGSIISFVRSTLGYAMPTFATSVVGYVSLYNGTPQLTIRSAADVVGGTVPTPTVTTAAVTNVTATGATSGGDVTAAGTSTVTARGIVWSTSPNPTTAVTTKTTDGSGTGAFTSTITGLAAATTYYVRAYATNSSGTAYGDQKTFTTPNPGGLNITVEDFEAGTKTAWASGSTTLTTGSWFFSDALTGSDASDIKTGNKAARVRGQGTNGYIETEFTIKGLKKVTLNAAQTNFSEPAGTPAFELQVSVDGGAWTKVGNTQNPAKGAFGTAPYEFDVNAGDNANVKVRILNTSPMGSANQIRINIDDVKFYHK